ncbi:MAG TPA: FAD-binding protein, partial [Acidimicrobiales bacterium]|nr:FAD-binding protein [Acidimicrobiales bacterium]
MSTEASIEAAATRLGAIAEHNVPLGEKTTYRVGGRSALFCLIDDEQGLVAVSEAVRQSGIDVLVVGKGSNLLVADAGFKGLAVALGDRFEAIEIGTDEAVVAGGAASYPVVARTTAASGLSGMEWAVGVPGSIGGAVRMNAGGHGSETADRLVSARLVDFRRGLDREVAATDLDLSYRHS